MKIVVKFRVKSLDHRECKNYYWSHFFVSTCWLVKFSEVEVELIHIKANGVMHEVVVGEIKFKWESTDFELTFFGILVIEI